MIKAIRSLFNHPGLRRTFVRLRVPLAIIAFACALSFFKPQWLLAGFAISMIGELIQLWSFASLDKNSDLAIRGPYAAVRNPMYLGRFVMLLGFVLLFGSAWAVLAYTIVYWFYMDTRVGREEALLRGVFGARYEDYCAKVSRFLPGTPLPGQPLAYWSWALFRQNNAGRNLLGTLAAWAVVAAWMFLR